MRRFAELIDNKVKKIINAESKEWCEDNLGGSWVETFEKNFASVGGTYDKDLNLFIPSKPYPSWIYNSEENNWFSPTPEPNDKKFYIWNEEILDWEEVIIEEEVEEL